MTEMTAWERLRSQFKPDGRGRFKTTDAMKVAVQIDNERLTLLKQIKRLEGELNAYKSHLRAVTAFGNK